DAPAQAPLRDAQGGGERSNFLFGFARALRKKRLIGNRDLESLAAKGFEQPGGKLSRHEKRVEFVFGGYSRDDAGGGIVLRRGGEEFAIVERLPVICKRDGVAT